MGTLSTTSMPYPCKPMIFRGLFVIRRIYGAQPARLSTDAIFLVCFKPKGLLASTASLQVLRL
jgi:hypothetical protein